ncbi:MAG TPA: autotransporter outer membrane beta-barrel domain-containing protein, partial [Elusimicrobiota bacterium]|nr:autotransporter outer membrane beta-barrel domain-containing protein [Elusimicrobiota bacterium]
HDFYATSRNINAFSRTATASPSGSEFNLDATGGWDVKTARALVSPFAELAYDRLMLGSFTEGGAGALDLAMAAQTAESLRSTLGVKVSRQYKPAWCDLTPYASLGWQHEFADQSRALAAQLASGGGATFTVQTADVARESALLGAGVNMDWTPGFSTRLSYQSTMSFDFDANTFSGSMRWRF